MFTVQCTGQERQCNSCLKFASKCPHGGIGGKFRSASDTIQKDMAEYMRELRELPQPGDGKVYKGSLEQQHNELLNPPGDVGEDEEESDPVAQHNAANQKVSILNSKLGNLEKLLDQAIGQHTKLMGGWFYRKFKSI